MKSKETKKVERAMGAPSAKESICVGCRYYRAPKVKPGTLIELKTDGGSWSMVAIPICLAFNQWLPSHDAVTGCEVREPKGHLRADVKLVGKFTNKIIEKP